LSVAAKIYVIGVNVGGVTTPDFGMGVEGIPLNIISYNVQEYEMRTRVKSGDFSEIERFV